MNGRSKMSRNSGSTARPPRARGGRPPRRTPGDSRCVRARAFRTPGTRAASSAVEIGGLRERPRVDAAVAQCEVRSYHKGAVGIREVPIAVAPICDHRIGRDECDEPERKSEDIDEGCERRAAQVAQRDREVMTDHGLDPRFARHDAAVEQMHDSVCLRGASWRVGHHHHGRTFAMQHAEHVHHVGTVAAVEVARRLVGEDQRGIVDERARDRDALLLAARERVGVLLRA